MKENELQTEMRVELGKLANDGVVFWRNNVGVATHFDKRANREVRVRYGLANGSADLIGCVDGVFVGLEVKQPGEYPTPEQRLWAELVRSKGGFVETVRSVPEALAAVERARRAVRT